MQQIKPLVRTKQPTLNQQAGAKPRNNEQIAHTPLTLNNTVATMHRRWHFLLSYIHAFKIQISSTIYLVPLIG